MFPDLRTKKEIDKLKELGLKEGIDFKIGVSYGKIKTIGIDENNEPEEKWEISFPGVLT